MPKRSFYGSPGSTEVGYPLIIKSDKLRTINKKKFGLYNELRIYIAVIVIVVVVSVLFSFGKHKPIKIV